MLYEIHTDEPKSGLASFRRLQKEIRPLSSKAKEKIYNLFTSIETLWLAALANAERIAHRVKSRANSLTEGW